MATASEGEAARAEIDWDRLHATLPALTIFQLLPPGLPADFPPLNTLDVAFRRGLRRAAAVAGVVVLLLGVLALAAINQAHRADRLARQEARQRRLAEGHLYVADMNLAQQAWEVCKVGRTLELLDAQRPQPGGEDVRGFEWRYLWRLCQGNVRVSFRRHRGSVLAVAFTPDGKTLAAGTYGGTVKLEARPKSPK